MIDVVRDAEGVRMALEELFEESYARSRIAQESAGAELETIERMELRVQPRTLSPGYYAFADHLLRIERLQKAGLRYGPRDLAAFECSGLVALDAARGGFESRHPKCGGCGAHQQNRFGVKCHACGAKFRREGK